MPKTYDYKRVKIHKYICPICNKYLNFVNFEIPDMCNWNNENNPCKKYINEKKYILDKNFDIINKEKQIRIIKYKDDEMKCKLLIDNIIIGTAVIYPEIKLELQDIQFYEKFMKILEDSKEINFLNIETENDIDFM